MATDFFWIGYHFEEFRSQVAIRKKELISRPEYALNFQDVFLLLHNLFFQVVRDNCFTCLAALQV